MKRSGDERLIQLVTVIWCACPVILLLTPGGKALREWLHGQSWLVLYKWILASAILLLGSLYFVEKALRTWLGRRSRN